MGGEIRGEEIVSMDLSNSYGPPFEPSDNHPQEFAGLTYLLFQLFYHALGDVIVAT